jgi:hypothetical protein
MYHIDIEEIFSYVGVRSPEKCAKWAFGEELKGTTPLCMLDEMWRKEHGDLFMIYGSDDFVLSMKRIGRAYIELKESREVGERQR